jgi:LPS-assembly lipoprotein
MWWPEPRPTVYRHLARGAVRFAARGAVLFALGGLLAGCFQPMYAQRSPTGDSALQARFASIGVNPIVAATGTLQARIAVELQNDLAYDFTGGGGPIGKAYNLSIIVSSQVAQVIVDINSARPEMQQFGLNATYNLVEVATGKRVISDSTFARVSIDNPGQQQRFANARGQRDAENRAAKTIAENIRARLASYFVAGT